MVMITMMMLITMMMMMNMTMKMTDLVAIASLRLAFHLVDCQVVQAVLVVVPHLGCASFADHVWRIVR